MFRLCIKAELLQINLVLFWSALTYTWQRRGLERYQRCLDRLTLCISSFNLYHVKFILCTRVHTGLVGRWQKLSLLFYKFHKCVYHSSCRRTILRSSWCSKSSSSGLNVTSLPASSTTPEQKMSKSVNNFCNVNNQKHIKLFDSVICGKNGGLPSGKWPSSIWTQGGAIRTNDETASTWPEIPLIEGAMNLHRKCGVRVQLLLLTVTLISPSP